MTWERTAAVTAAAEAGRVWAVLLDGRRWSLWNDGIEWMVLEGPLQPGTLVTVKPRRAPQTALRIEAAVPERVLALAVTFGPAARMRLRWELHPTAEGTSVAQTVAVDGPLAGILLRRAAGRIAAGMPAALARLSERAATAASDV